VAGGAVAVPGAAPKAKRLDAALAFLREELAPSPQRWRATGRIVISCTIATTLLASLHLPDAAWLIITIFIVSLPNAGATLQKGFHRLAGTMVACAAGVVCVAAFIDLPWLRVPIGGLAAGFAMFLNRTTTAPYAAILGGLTFALFFLDPSLTIEPIVAFGLWRTLLVLTGVGIVLLVDLLLLPTDPERQLLADLERRLAAAHAILARALGDDEPRGAARPDELRALVLSGLAAEIDLLADAEARHRGLRFRHPEQIVLITAVERLSTAVLALQRAVDSTGVDPAAGPLAERIAAIRDGVAVLGRVIAERRVPEVWKPPATAGLAADAIALGAHEPLLPAVVELEEALRQGAPALGFLAGASAPVLARPEQLRSVLDAPPSGLLTPAFSLSNTADIQLALKTALAEVLMYLVLVGTAWPGIETGLVTVLVIAGASNGAMIHKATLRCAGAALGGLIGLVVILVAMPIITTIAGFLLVNVGALAIAAYVVTGGPRTSYAGMQMGLALALVLSNSLGPTTDLVVARDRVFGVLIADTITTLIFYALWPVVATKGMRRALAGTVHAIADLSRVGARLVPEDLVRPARGYRWQVYQGLATTLSMHDEAAFEPNAGTAEVVSAREAVRRFVPLAQEVFLGSLAVANHRLDANLWEAPQAVVEKLRAYSAGLGEKLDAIGDRLSGAVERPSPDLGALLDAARKTVAEHRAALAASAETAGVLSHAEARIEVQRELLELVERADDAARAIAPRLAALG
jgi:multidrug resistance protein MdtO